MRGVLRDGVSTTGGGLAAGAAVPDTDGLALDSVLAAELAHVAGVLCDLGGGSVNMSSFRCSGVLGVYALPSS